MSYPTMKRFESFERGRLGGLANMLASMFQALWRRNRRLYLNIIALVLITAFVWYGQVRLRMIHST